MTDDATPKTPVHLWIVGILSLLWGAAGAGSYVMVKLGVEAATASMDERQHAFLEAYPAWLTAFWALAVWTGLLASLLLLARKALAAPLFVFAFVCMAVTTVRNFVLEDGADVLGTGGVVFAVVIFVICLGQLLYARAMAAKGVLS